MRHDKLKLLLVVGARPNFIKIAPIVRELSKESVIQEKKLLSWKLVNTGQHYYYDMSSVFFEEIVISQPDYSLNVG